MKKVNNAECVEVFNANAKALEEIKQSVYDYFKTVTVLSESNNYYGGSADAFKQYLQIGELNFINTILNICNEFQTEFVEAMKSMYEFEPHSSGKIAQELVEEIKDKISSRGKDFSGIIDDITDVNSKAASYISVSSVDTLSVGQAFKNTVSYLEDVNTRMEEYDKKEGERLEAFLDRLNTFKVLVESASSKDFVKNKIALESAGLTTKPSETTYVLAYMMKEDPFYFDSLHGAKKEDQVAAGWTKDVYIYAGYRLVGGSYQLLEKDGITTINAEGSCVEGNIYGQFTDYARLSGAAKVGYGNITTKQGWTDEYKGINAKGEIGAGKIDGKLSIGPEDTDLAYIKGEAKGLAADGYVVAEFEDKDNFAIGLGGSASVASAKGSIGTDLFSVEAEDSKTGKKESLFGIEIGGKFGATASAEASYERKEIWENDYISVQSNKLKIGGSFGLGVDITVTIPSFSFN